MKAAASSEILAKDHETARGITQKVLLRRKAQWNTGII
jgi:hypothetical protein